ncbi:glycosyltransferase family A protein [Microbacterium panaciterrae]|uniref:Glycosyltransferase 2-like domain-containing protein n=1 Tax=Microbacterium panaciterrae TaxID=985759 RepID=A0ABP8PG11_9MICO
MTGDARVTVAIVAYRHAAYIEQCVASIRNQSVPCRILVLDDCSPDDTADVIRRLAAEEGSGPQITALLQQENIGLPANLNIALRLADTDYFVYLAGDDWSLPDRLEKQIAALDAAGPDAGLCYTDCLRARADSTLHDERFSQNHAHVFSPDAADPYRELLLVDNWIPAPTVMFRTSVLRVVGGFDEAIRYEDHDTYVRIAREHRLVYVDEALSVHRELDDGLGTEIFRPNSRDWLEGQLLMERKQLGVDPALTRELCGRLRVRAIRLFKLGGDTRLAAETMGMVVRARPTLDPVLWGYWLLARMPRRARSGSRHRAG